MKRELIFILSCLGWALIAYILLFPHPASAEGNPPKAQLQLVAMPNTMVKSPMNISFHGGAGAVLNQGGNSSSALTSGDDQVTALPGFNDHLARIQAYVLKYVTIGANSYDNRLETSDKLSVEFQAGLTDLSYALFFVMPI